MSETRLRLVGINAIIPSIDMYYISRVRDICVSLKHPLSQFNIGISP